MKIITYHSDNAPAGFEWVSKIQENDGEAFWPIWFHGSDEKTVIDKARTFFDLDRQKREETRQRRAEAAEKRRAAAEAREAAE